VDQEGQSRQLTYDRLVVATGAVPVRPRITGIDLPSLSQRSMADSFAVHQHLTAYSQSVVIIGGGYGLEMADALNYRGLAVTVVEHSESVLTVDPSLAGLSANCDATASR